MTTLDRIRALLEAPPDPEDAEATRAWCDTFDATMELRDPDWREKLAKFMEAENDTTETAL